MWFSRAQTSVSLSMALAASFASLTAASPALAATENIAVNSPASPAKSTAPTPAEIAAANAFASKQAAKGQTLLGSAIPFADFGGKPAIAAFYAQDFLAPGDPQTYTRAIGYVFLGVSVKPGNVEPAGENQTRRILIGAFEPEGDTPAIAAVFLMNPGVSAKRLFVALVDYNVNHRDTVQGTLHETFVFDASDAALAGKQLPLMKALSHKVDGGCECDYGKGVESVKFKTVREVRAGLRALGY